MKQILRIQLRGNTEIIEKKRRYIESKILELRHAGQEIRVPTRYTGKESYTFVIKGEDIRDLERKLRTYIALYEGDEFVFKE